MKYIAALTALLILASPGAKALDIPGDPSVHPNGSRHEVQQSTIRSRAQLLAYVAVTPASPLAALAPKKRQAFINSLVFTDKGVGSFSATQLQELSPTEVRNILGLFGRI